MQPVNKNSAEAFAAIAVRLAERSSLKKISFSSPDVRSLGNVSARPVDVRGERMLCFEFRLSEGRLRHENVKLSDCGEKMIELLSEYRRADASDASGNVSFMRSIKGKCTVIDKTGDFCEEKTNVLGNDRKINRILSGNEPFLREIGISDKNGRVYDKKQAKFRQISRFCELLGDIASLLPSDRTVYVYDLCCGKSYLGFAVRHYLREIRGFDTEFVCVDLKQSVIDDCAAIANRLGYTDMHFICGDIAKLIPEHSPDLVLSLHACDIATDIVLHFAVQHGAKLIMSTPCCHHELVGLLDVPELAFVSDYPILKQKLADALTDALRVKRLAAAGYKAEAVELTDPEDTPKNVLIRAVKRHSVDARASREAKQAFDAAKDFLNIKNRSHIE